MAAANYFFFVVPPFGFFPVGFAGEPLGGAVPAAMPLLTVPAFKSTVKLSPEPVFPVAGSTVMNSPAIDVGETVMRMNPKVLSL